MDKYEHDAIRNKSKRHLVLHSTVTVFLHINRNELTVVWRGAKLDLREIFLVDHLNFMQHGGVLLHVHGCADYTAPLDDACFSHTGITYDKDFDHRRIVSR